MQHNYMRITYAYHVICELMILFFLTIPIFHYYYEAIPYISYSLIVLGATLVFVLFFQKVTSYVPYMLVAPGIMAVFYLASYPLVMSVLLGAAFTWRAIILRKEHRLDSEGTYLRLILILSVTMPLFIHELTFIVFVVSMIFLLIIGNIVRNMTALPKQDRRSKSTAFLVGVFGLVVAGVAIVYASFTGVRGLIGLIWSGIVQLLTWAGSLLVYVLSLIPLPEAQEEDEEELVESGGEYEPPESTPNTEPLLENLLTWIIIIASVIAVFFIIRFIRRQLKKTFKPLNMDEGHVSYEQMSVDEGKKSWRDRFRAFMPAPKDSVRKQMFQFEKKMNATDQGRKPEETIEQWVTRTGWTIDFELYQRVRYGTYQATKAEAKHLEMMIKKIYEDEKKD